MSSTSANWSGLENLLNFSGRRRLPVILQTEAAECGLTCLAMVASFYGRETDLPSLRQRISFSSHGATLKQVMDAAARMHLASRAVRVEINHMGTLQLPCVLHWEMNHFVVLKEVAKNHFVIHDPAFGEKHVSADEFNHRFTGVALELTPTSEFEIKDDQRKLSLSSFWSRVQGLASGLIHLILLGLLLQLFAILSPFYMQIVVDDVLLRNDTNLLMTLALGFGLLLLIEIGTNLLRSVVVMHFSTRLSIQMAANLFRHLIRLPMDYFSKRHMGDVVSRFGSLDSIRGMLTGGLVSAVLDGILMIIMLVVMFYYDATLSLITLVVVALYGATRYAFYHPVRLLTAENLVAAAKTSTHFMETVRAIQTIKIFQRENERQAQWQNKLAESLNKSIAIQRWGIGFDVINRVLTGGGNIVVIYFGAKAVMANDLSLGMLYAFLSYKNRFSDSINSLIGNWISFKMLDVHLDRLADIVFTPPENIDAHLVDAPIKPDSSPPSALGFDAQEQPAHDDRRLRGKIEVHNLAFSYSESERPVFKNVTFSIEAGETVAITGPSGCGKTTLMKCLMGLLAPTEGEILVDGVPLKSQSAYRSQIAGVMQEDRLMSGSISDNIACFSSHIDTKKVEHCARLACVDRDIVRMPMQYHTLVGDMGSSLSGGQLQRIMLARALYREPRMLFLDEATSHLDVNNEFLVNDNIKRLSITRVLVAHRPETVRSAQRQIRLDHRSDPSTLRDGPPRDASGHSEMAPSTSA